MRMQLQAGYGRHSRQAKHSNLERWLLTYADLITLLLAFFVIMYGMSSADATKFSKLAQSMKRAFNVGVLQGDPSASILDQTMGISSEAGSAEDMSAAARELDTIYNELGWALQEESLADKLTVETRSEGIAISLSGNLLFASGRADLRPEAVELLHSVSRVLARLPNQVRVEGHTDDIPPTGTEFSSNWELSGARSVAVVRYFAEIEGIDPSRLSAVAYSQYQPRMPNESPRSRARNRRSEILILHSPASSSAPARPGADGGGAAPTPEMETRDAFATR